MLLVRSFCCCFSFKKKIVIACNNGLFSVKHKVMSKCVLHASAPLRIATPTATKFVQLYVPLNLLVHFLDCFAWIGSRHRRRRRRRCSIFRSFISFVVNVFRYFRSNPSSFVYDHCCCSSIENCMEFKYRVCAVRQSNAPMFNALLCCCSLRCASTENPNRIFISLFNVHFRVRGVNFLVLCNVSSWNRGPLFTFV